MGSALAEAALMHGHQVTIVSGPVNVEYPAACRCIEVVTTDEMLDAVERLFPEHDGLIGAAAPCDYQPRRIQSEKIAKNGQPLQLELIETADIVATLAMRKRPRQWVVGFALETEDQRFRAIVKMQRKSCDLMVSNGPSAINSLSNDIEILLPDGTTVDKISGDKATVAAAILRAIENHLVNCP
jgi:phosphopantothenoylcysteine decarboxylase / phosphopantothenate---cysteine ligase